MKASGSWECDVDTAQLRLLWEAPAQMRIPAASLGSRCQVLELTTGPVRRIETPYGSDQMADPSGA